MKRVIWVVVAVALIWSAWWAVAALALQRGVQDWLAERRAEGWQAEAEAFHLAGYPSRLELAMETLALADPARGVAIEFTSLAIASKAWWPGHATLIFPDAPIAIAAPKNRALLQGSAARAELNLRPGTDLQVADMGLGSGPWQLGNEAGTLLAASDITLTMVQDAAERSAYTFDANVTAFAPGEALRRDLNIPESWPASFDALRLQADVAFDRPWDLPAIEGARPQPRRIDLHLAEASWGAVLLRASAALDVDPDGSPTGTLSLQARNWREMLAVAEASGSLPPQLRPQVERALSLLASASGNPDAIDVTLTLSDGAISLGFLPLAPAPRLILR
jgi:hypothetical protein